MGERGDDWVEVDRETFEALVIQVRAVVNLDADTIRICEPALTTFFLPMPDIQHIDMPWFFTVRHDDGWGKPAKVYRVNRRYVKVTR